MNSHFQVGEIAIACNILEPYAYLIGEECEIVGGLRLRQGVTRSGQLVRETRYLIRFTDGRIVGLRQDQLRKRFDRGDWSALRDVWQPRSREVAP